MADSNTTETDEFWHGVWWVPDSDGGVRNATPGECAEEIKRLRKELEDCENAALNRSYDRR